jgi:formylglycine-generating enzyme required for sulfatase activity
MKQVGVLMAAAVASVMLFMGCSGKDDDSGGGGKTKTINGIECVFVEAGTFMMGGGIFEKHEVTLTKGFWIGKYIITQEQYRAVMDTNPSNCIGDRKPVQGMTWFGAVSFCEKVGGRLPIEAEWEFAARGGNNSNGYTYSGSNDWSEVAWWDSNLPPYDDVNCIIQPVGQKKPNELGIYDMSGNIGEFCSDWYGDYPTTAVTDPTGPDTGTRRVSRGGDASPSGHYLNSRVFERGNAYPDNIYRSFRIVFDVN